MNGDDDSRLAFSLRLCARIEPFHCSPLALGIPYHSPDIGWNSGRTGFAPSSGVGTAASRNGGMRSPSLIATSFFLSGKKLTVLG